MRIPLDATIDNTKLTDYLWSSDHGTIRAVIFDAPDLVKDWPNLRTAIRQLADDVEAIEDGSSEYGTFYRVEGH